MAQSVSPGWTTIAVDAGEVEAPTPTGWGTSAVDAGPGAAASAPRRRAPPSTARASTAARHDPGQHRDQRMPPLGRGGRQMVGTTPLEDPERRAGARDGGTGAERRVVPGSELGSGRQDSSHGNHPPQGV